MKTATAITIERRSWCGAFSWRGLSLASLIWLGCGSTESPTPARGGASAGGEDAGGRTSMGGAAGSNVTNASGGVTNTTQAGTAPVAMGGNTLSGTGADGKAPSPSGGSPNSNPPTSEAAGPPPVLWLTAPGVNDPNEIGEEDQAGELRVIEKHDGTHASPSAFATSAAALETHVTLHTRGKSSLGFDKKSFALELTDASGQQVKLPLLGMPKESDWVLHGPYSDKTYLRNALAYWLGREIYRGSDGKVEPGRWSPRTRFAELYINQQYWGVYVVVERVKADSDRVDVDRPALESSNGDVTGGYIIRREGGGDGEGNDWTSSVERLVYTHHYPKVHDLSVAQRDYIRGYFDAFESMMRSDTWNDPNLGYPAWLDVPSVLDYFLAMEWTNNVDGYFKSVYMVKHSVIQGGRLSFGPLWDFDIAFGNADYRNGNETSNWVYKTRGREESVYDPPGEVPFIPAYVTRLWRDSAFRQALRCRWQALRNGPLASQPIEAQIDMWVAQLAEAEVRDHRRWPVIGTQLWPNPVVWPSYAAEVAYLKQFMRQRFEFMDAEFVKLAPAACL